MLIQAETGVIDITGLPDKDGVDGRAKVGHQSVIYLPE